MSLPKRCGFSPWVRKIPWRREWQPTPVVLPGEIHGQRSLVGYSPWGHKESNMTKWLTLSHFLPIHPSQFPSIQEMSYLFTVYTIFPDLRVISAKSPQSCPTLCNPIDGSPPGSPIPGSLQARTLEWVAISFSNAWKWKVKVKSLSRVRLLATPWTAAYQASPSMRFSRQEYWSGVPLPSPRVI